MSFGHNNFPLLQKIAFFWATLAGSKQSEFFFFLPWYKYHKPFFSLDRSRQSSPRYRYKAINFCKPNHDEWIFHPQDKPCLKIKIFLISLYFAWRSRNLNQISNSLRMSILPFATWTQYSQSRIMFSFRFFRSFEIKLPPGASWVTIFNGEDGIIPYKGNRFGCFSWCIAAISRIKSDKAPVSAPSPNFWENK